MKQLPAHLIGIDDAPFPPDHRGDVPIVGALFSHLRLEAVLHSKVRRDGANATQNIECMIRDSRFAPQLQGILLQGIAFAGFNVVDIQALHEHLDLPVIVVCRKLPGMEAIKQALETRVLGGKRKWRLIQQAGPMEPAGNIFIQRAGISYEQAARLIKKLAINGNIPEPLRTAHLIATGLSAHPSHQRV